MHRLRVRALVLVGGAAYVVSLALLMGYARAGNLTPAVRPLIALPLVISAAVVVGFGRQVRRLTRRQSARISHADAVRVLNLAQAAAVVAVLMIGYLLAQLSVALTNISAPYPQAQAWGAGVGLIAASLLLAAGIIVEGWCVINDDDDDPTRQGGSGAAA